MYSIKLQGVEANDPAKISTLYKQKANRKVLGTTPYLSLYYFGRKFYKPAKIQRWIEEYRVQTNAKIAAAGTDSVKISDILAKREQRLAHPVSHFTHPSKAWADQPVWTYNTGNYWVVGMPNLQPQSLGHLP